MNINDVLILNQQAVVHAHLIFDLKLPQVGEMHVLFKLAYIACSNQLDLGIDLIWPRLPMLNKYGWKCLLIYLFSRFSSYSK